MNTRLDVLFWGDEQLTFENAFQQIVANVNEVELTFSRYNENSELFNLNEKGHFTPINVSERLMKAVRLCAVYYEQTVGYFDISRGTQFNQLKGGEDITPGVGSFSDRVTIDTAKKTIHLLHPDVLLDFGGIGKGMALEVVAEIIDRQHIENAFVSFGESSILTRGRHPHGDYWPFGLANFAEYQWKLTNDSLSISSRYRMVSDGKKAHILNPFLPKVPDVEKTVVIQANDPVQAEVLSTALIAAPEVDHSGILANFKTAKPTIIKPNLI
jgi:thiamine biosynthesis lipoprotein ApbE